ncbi:fanconi anemia group M protein [Ceratobasidium sp. AG-Ba]|nr:fanconi anemia group M protein [Ceratobasidium sp. AG-Ba]
MSPIGRDSASVELPGGPWPELRMPSRLTFDHFSRFNRYAQGMITLDLQTSEHHVSDGNALLAYAARHTLLPQLQRLLIRTGSINSEELDWIAALFSPSIQEIRFIPSPGTESPLTSDRTLYFLESISRKCPRLEVLEIHPFDDWLDWNDEPDGKNVPDVDPRLQNRFWEPLARLENLRSFYTNPYLAQLQDMATFSSFPTLELLDLSKGGPFTEIIRLDDTCDLFPSLRHLALRNLKVAHHEAFWDRAPFLHTLESFHLVIGPQDHNSELYEWFPPGMNVDTFTRLSRLTIHIQAFHPEALVVIGLQELACIALLPLRFLCILGVFLDGDTDDQGERWSKVLARWWPDMEELHWSAQSANLLDLSHFAVLDKLQHLTFNLKMTRAPNIMPPVLNRSIVFKRLETSGSQRIGKRGIGFLRDLWPNVSFVYPSGHAVDHR